MNYAAHCLSTKGNKEKTLRLAVLYLFGFTALAACSTVARQSQSIRIASAIYSVQGLTIPCDVTTKVATICDGLTDCTVMAQSRLCPMGDPAPTRQKLLTVKYACGTAEILQAEILEGNNLILTCSQ
jgi:hypothetical protein